MKFNAGLAVEVGESLIDAAIGSHEDKETYTVVYCNKLNKTLALKGDTGHEEYGYKVSAHVSDTL